MNAVVIIIIILIPYIYIFFERYSFHIFELKLDSELVIDINFSAIH